MMVLLTTTETFGKRCLVLQERQEAYVMSIQKKQMGHGSEADYGLFI